MLNRLIFVLLAFALFGCSSRSPSADKKETADIHLRMGTTNLQQGNYPQALQELLLAVELDPKNPIIHNNLALAYYVRDKFTEAETHLKKALDLDSRYADARNNLGRVYISMKLYDQAIVELKVVTNDLTYPSPEKPLSNLALAYYKKGDFKLAKETAYQALKVEKSFCPAQSVYGLSLFFLEDYKKSADTFEKVINQCEREKEEAHYYSALSYFKLGQKEKSTARLQEMIHLYPDGEYTEKARTTLGIIN